ncbi:PH domain-containing protein [Virgibacillus sp. MSP4-1]|uniref:PH domain-containing protein n=1 Tax=Virgibacillus sp. MSP4-1 TaxID=2700081 RepID=UPI0003A9B24F|nr:PH domain-containing protein [Virgibacillus sp. MSP4-1]QHS23991.1 PH domain-containing protein [Virgibacillus sp. MSP4-1]
MTPIQMHPLKIVYSIIKTLKNSLFFIIYLFVLNFKDESTFIVFGKFAFAAFLVLRFIYLIIEWWKTKYVIKEGSIHLYRGLFTKRTINVPLDQVQNVQWHSPPIYRLFHLTYLSLETSTTNEEGSIKFEAIKEKEAEWIEQQLNDYKEKRFASEQRDESLKDYPEEKERTVHFSPTRKDVLKASFLSLSFVALIPILGSVYQEFNHVMNLEQKLHGFLAFLTSSWLFMAAAITLLVLIAAAFGIIRTFLKYGKYEIASDPERIFIHSGVLNERALSIRKENVQAIQVTQSFLKRLLGFAEVKLISAENKIDDQTEEISTLYPFIPIERTYSLIEELLPDFKIQPAANKLPRVALIVRLLRIPWLWIIATGLLLWLKPEWWYGSIILFVLTYMQRIFHYQNTRFLMNNGLIQFEVKGLGTKLFITDRKKIVEAEVEQSLLQKKFSLATISTINRTKPIHLEHIQDISTETSRRFLRWYQERANEVKTES